MENNQVTFDPMTGQPIIQNVNNTPVNGQTVPIINETGQVNQTVLPTQQYTTNNINSINTVQQEMQNIPTVEQNKQDFINNTQINSTVKEEPKKEGPNIAFIVIIFLIIFAAMFFLFPFLLKTLG